MLEELPDHHLKSLPMYYLDKEVGGVFYFEPGNITFNQRRLLEKVKSKQFVDVSENRHYMAEKSSRHVPLENGAIDWFGQYGERFASEHRLFGPEQGFVFSLLSREGVFIANRKFISRKDFAIQFLEHKDLKIRDLRRIFEEEETGNVLCIRDSDFYYPRLMREIYSVH
jgi:hypothetical protein